MTLENLKDRAVTISAIYLRIGVNNYLDIENFEDHLLVLRPYESYHKTYGPIEFYTMNTRRVVLSDLLRDKSVKKQLYLSTLSGRYRVRHEVGFWNPVLHYFENHLTGILRPVRSMYREQSIGSNVAFVLQLTFDGENDQIVPLGKSDYKLKMFRHFDLTEESLSSKQALVGFIQSQIDAGVLPCKSFEVFDMAEWRQSAHDPYKGETVRAQRFSAFEYYILGRATTIYSDWKMTRENKRRDRNRETHVNGAKPRPKSESDIEPKNRAAQSPDQR